MAKPKARLFKEGEVIDYLTAAAITGGTPTDFGAGQIGIPQSDIASGDTAALLVGKIIKIECDNTVGNMGDNVWFDNNGNPVGGTAGSGAATTSGAVGDSWLGTLAVATAAADTHAILRLNVANPNLPHFPARVHELAGATLTLDIQDSGKVIHDLTDNAVITLPATAVGSNMIFVIQNDAADGAAKISIDPNINDLIQGQNIAGTINKDLINTKITAKRGDYVVLQGGHADGYNIIEMRGIWATQA